jgi:hypothetical protein
MNQYPYYRIIYTTLNQYVTPLAEDYGLASQVAAEAITHVTCAWNLRTTDRISVEKRLLPGAKIRVFLYCSDSPETEPAHESLRDCP